MDLAAPSAAAPSPAAPAAGRSRGALVLTAGVLAAGAGGVWTRHGAGSGAPRAQAPALSVPVAPATTATGAAAVPMPAAEIAAAHAQAASWAKAFAVANVGASNKVVVKAVEPPFDPDAEAELPPVPKDSPSDRLIIYGVVYDLATKRPVKHAWITIEPGGPVARQSTSTYTDQHGWYQVEFPRGGLAYGAAVHALAEGYPQGRALQETDPPLASLSPGRRRAIPEEAPETVHVTLAPSVPLAELDLVLNPMKWPKGMPLPVYAEVDEPQIPGEPDDYTCRVYGVAYDVATKSPMRDLPIGVSGSSQHTTTDKRGNYVLDVSVRQINQGASIASAAIPPGYRSGIAAERDPPLLFMSAKERRELADMIEFEIAKLPEDCDEGVLRVDLLAMPEQWP